MITIFLVSKSRKEVAIKAFVNSRMFSSGVFIFLLALIRSYVWFYFNFVSLLPFLIFLFICRGGSGGKPQCFILLTEFWQLWCFITMHKLFLRDKLFFKSLILTRTTTISKVNFYCYSIVSFFFYFTFNITKFLHLLLFVVVVVFISFIISRWIYLNLSLVLFRKCISYKANNRMSDVFHLPAVDHRIKRRIKELQCHSVKLQMLHASAWSRSEGNSKECTNVWQIANC